MIYTRRLAMHLNGGSKFSEARYEVLVDGKPCGIRYVIRTNGRPKYQVTNDYFTDGKEVFDRMKASDEEAIAWLDAHAKAKA